VEENAVKITVVKILIVLGLILTSFGGARAAEQFRSQVVSFETLYGLRPARSIIGSPGDAGSCDFVLKKSELEGYVTVDATISPRNGDAPTKVVFRIRSIKFDPSADGMFPNDAGVYRYLIEERTRSSQIGYSTELSLFVKDKKFIGLHYISSTRSIQTNNDDGMGLVNSPLRILNGSQVKEIFCGNTGGAGQAIQSLIFD
jgi:hypothetical protein